VISQPIFIGPASPPPLVVRPVKRVRTSVHPGVSRRTGGRWRAVLNGRWIGSYATELEAAHAVEEERLLYGQRV
jgi:hypothetical protein